MHPVEILRRPPGGGAPVTLVDRCGAVLAPAAKKGVTRPVYSYGFPDSGALEPLFTCPVSAIPRAAWDLLELWWQSKMLRLPVKPGGLLDQPLSVRAAFPIFEAEWLEREARSSAARSASGMAAAFGAMFGRR